MSMRFNSLDAVARIDAWLATRDGAASASGVDEALSDHLVQDGRLRAALARDIVSYIVASRCATSDQCAQTLAEYLADPRRSAHQLGAAARAMSPSDRVALAHRLMERVVDPLSGGSATPGLRA